MKNLLRKTRKLNKEIQSYGGDDVSFSELSQSLSYLLDANVYIASKKGKILGTGFILEYSCSMLMEQTQEDTVFPEEFNKKILSYDVTQENIFDEYGCDFSEEYECELEDKISTVIPINSGGIRLGTLLISRFGKKFTEEDLILAEYGATIVGMEILKSESSRVEEEAREASIVQMALNSLSYSEMEALEHIFYELDGEEGLLVASKIADRIGITRSVIVNALRKLESAGIIESRSLGMKGTHIKVLNTKLLEELKLD